MMDKNCKESSRLLLFGDSLGCPTLLRNIPRDKITGLVAAEIRPSSIEFVSSLASQYQLPLLIQPRYTNNERYNKFIEQVTKLQPDLFVIYSYSMLLREDLLSIPRNGGVNIHGGTLPEYRGSNPIQWEIINGEESAGVSLHRVVKEIDAGDIIESRCVPIDFCDTWDLLLKKLSAAAEEILQSRINSVISGSSLAIRQDHNRAITRRRRYPEDGAFDWSMPAIRIYNLIRAISHPHPGAFTISPDGMRVNYPNFLSIAEVLEEKSKVYPLVLATGERITIDLPRSSIDTVSLMIADKENNDMSSITISNIRKSSLSATAIDNYKDALLDFCKIEFGVSHVQFVPNSLS